MRKVLYILGELSDLDIDWIINTGAKQSISRDTVLVRQGQPVDALLFVLKGGFKVTLPSKNDVEIARLGAGEIIGEVSFVDSKPASASVTALEDSVVFAVERQKLLDKLKQDMGFAARFYRAVAMFLSIRLRTTTGLLAYFGKSELTPEEKEEHDELDSGVLDNVSMAGSRFDRMLKRLMG
jgi:CRP-like cAMP-binding protein